jgi:succinylglutamic semialdehyde dehydrogenase
MTLLKGKGLYIDGQWVKANGSELSSYDPATGQLLWQGAEAISSDVDLAINSARHAFKEWWAYPVNERIAFVQALANELKANGSQLAEAISKETGKPLWESKEEVASMINKIPISIDALHQRTGDHVQEHPNAVLLTRHHAHGVIVVLGPFNFPGHLPHGQIVPALLAGNAVVFKPSELTPGVGEMMADLWDKAGLPPGVFNLLQGKGNVGKLLAEHKAIDGLFFTGSWNTGKWLSEHFAKTPGKILALEMGGNNPLIVSEYNDLNAAVFLTIQSSFLSSGQRCTCARRLIVPQTKSGDAFLEALKRAVSAIRVGAYNDDPAPYMGPVITIQKAQELLGHQHELQKLGGIPLIEMRSLKENSGLLSPGLIDVTAVKNREDEELFGPLLQVIRVPDFYKAVEEANQTSYGLSAGLISSSRNEYEIFYQSIKAGIINWNMATTGASSKAPFGGVGRSGNNRPGAFYAADFCSYPVASLERETAVMPQTLPPGLQSTCL